MADAPQTDPAATRVCCVCGDPTTLRCPMCKKVGRLAGDAGTYFCSACFNVKKHYKVFISRRGLVPLVVAS